MQIKPSYQKKKKKICKAEKGHGKKDKSKNQKAIDQKGTGHAHLTIAETSKRLFVPFIPGISHRNLTFVSSPIYLAMAPAFVSSVLPS